MAANQCEGAWDAVDKGVSAPDLCANGSHTSPKWVTASMKADRLYPSREANDFYHHYIDYLRQHKDKEVVVTDGSLFFIRGAHILALLCSIPN